MNALLDLNRQTRGSVESDMTHIGRGLCGIPVGGFARVKRSNAWLQFQKSRIRSAGSVANSAGGRALQEDEQSLHRAVNLEIRFWSNKPGVLHFSINVGRARSSLIENTQAVCF